MPEPVGTDAPAETDPPGRRRPPSRVSQVVALVTVVAAVAIVLARGWSLLDRVWAEDGSVFLAGGLVDGLGAAGTPYAGYLHVIPRLTAAAVVQAPASSWAIALAVAYLLLLALATLLTLLAAAQRLTRTWVAVLVALAPTLVPVVTDEPILSIANAQFVLVPALWWLLALRRSLAGAATTGGLVVYAVVVGLSSPLVAALVPAAGYVLWRRRQVRDAVAVAVAVLATTAVQTAVLLWSSGGGGGRDLPGAPTAGSIASIVNAYVTGLFPGTPSFEVPTALLRAGTLLAGAVLVAFVVTAVLAARRQRELLPLALLAQAAIVFGFQAVLTQSLGPRYVYSTSVFVAWAALAALDPRWSARTVVPAALLGLMAAATLASWGPSSERASGPSWTAEVTAAQRDCPPGGTAAVPLSPDWWQGTVPVPCGPSDGQAPTR